MLNTLLAARTVGAQLCTAAVEPDFVGRRFLSDLGFEEVGRPLKMRPGDPAGELQPLCVEVNKLSDLRPALVCAPPNF
ncbi:MAG: hypothetical protein K1X39_14670 [Thermoflexales bacterium]|nr:hypothetical protein [Thermoflexales bacterium]